MLFFFFVVVCLFVVVFCVFLFVCFCLFFSPAEVMLQLCHACSSGPNDRLFYIDTHRARILTSFTVALNIYTDRKRAGSQCAGSKIRKMILYSGHSDRARSRQTAKPLAVLYPLNEKSSTIVTNGCSRVYLWVGLCVQFD